VPLRLAILAPRFWPLAGEAEMHLLRLAERFCAEGMTTTVVTPLWRKEWPRQLCVGEVPVVRLRGAPRGGLSTLRYMYALSRWLADERGNYDLVLAASLRHEAYVAARALDGTTIPLVLHAEPGEVAWQRTASFGSRIARRCRQAQAIVATSPLVETELQQSGYDAARIVTIPPGVPIPPPRGAAARDAARQSLAGVNHDLFVPTENLVALGIGRLTREEGWGDLVKAWRSIAARWPEARLWIVGDGPEREKLYHLIGDLDLRYRVLLPGTFGETDGLYAAADLFIRPALAAGNPLHLAEALAAGLPSVATDLACHRPWIEPDKTGLVVAPGDVRGLSAAIARLIEHPAQAIMLGAAARERMKQQATLEACAARYIELFEGLASR
jgi:glycosyltransferase involved in cell wall biosynthesis